MKITLLGYDEDTGLVMYSFENTMGGEDIQRGINPVLDDDGKIDIDSTEHRAEEVGRGIKVKMQLRRREKRKKKTATEHGIKKFQKAEPKSDDGEAAKEKPKRKTRKKAAK